ncbi:MAG: Type IIS restriction enzyme Eco57I [Nitrospira sp.]|nr:Type IIS restriction enzyme Eco57I [Nitrospira sp.]
MGRLLFLRFMEEKEWLPRNTLRDGWENHASDYYRSFLLPLFRYCDTTNNERAERNDAIPYLNGGLFAFTADDDLATLPDDLFNPISKRRTILDLLYRYHFTLDEQAGRDQQVSINPEMFGKVLESLSPGEERKKQGIHYTPEPIARALAVGGILPRLERRGRDRGLMGLSRDTLLRVYAGDRTALDPHVAEQLLEELRDLKILDPAVGSGSLLVACLEVLLAIEKGLKKTIGEDLQKGSLAWAKSARHFITECLYGVDISVEAVDVARLRLWLVLAVGESRPAALPDLGYNLRVGNSLGYDVVEDRLLVAIEVRGERNYRLPLTPLDKPIDAALDARAAFRRAQGGPPEELKRSFQSLEKAERSLRAALGTPTDGDEAPPFSWAVHFSEVFGGKNRGFDVVIANPPYVRSASLDDTSKVKLKALYRSWKGNNDLYFPFIERCLRAPCPADSEDTPSRPAAGLAGRAGMIAFIMPNFANNKSAEQLRELLADGGHVDTYVDFVDHQVFPTASNYVALLFASPERRKRKTFPAQIVTGTAFARMTAGESWLEDLEHRSISYQAGGWPVRSGNRPLCAGETMLGEIAVVATGIQTSWDDFYLCNIVRETEDAANVVVRNKLGEMTIERAMLVACAKGSTEIRGNRFIGRLYVVWPYDESGAVITEESLRSRFPLAWDCFWRQREQLMAREKGKFDGPLWWRFRRPQGVAVARHEKILIPSIMQSASAYHDRAGQVICTASGSGGGGGWTIRLREGAEMAYERLAEFLTSDDYWQWLEENGSPWRGGWRGVDQKILNRVPVPMR